MIVYLYFLTLKYETTVQIFNNKWRRHIVITSYSIHYTKLYDVLGGIGYKSPSDMVNIAGIGVGSQGGGDIQNIATPDVPIKRAFSMAGFLMQPS